MPLATARSRVGQLGIANSATSPVAINHIAFVQDFRIIHISPSFAFQDLINVQFSIFIRALR